MLTSELMVDPDIGVIPQATENLVELSFSEKPRAGNKYIVSLEVTDSLGNRNRLHIPFFGINERLPRLIISEFSPEGSKNNPDRIELYVLSGGIMSGIAFYLSHPLENDPDYIFPDIEVKAGEFIIIHAKSQNIPGETPEIDNKSVASSKGTHDSAWDVWLPESPGLSNTTGSIIITEYPRGPIIDAVSYTVKTLDEAHRYLGYGRKGDLELLEYLVHKEHWQKQETPIGPHLAIFSELSTSTRSINRYSDRDKNYVDSNSASDWYIVPNRSSSFGERNNPDVYAP